MCDYLTGESVPVEKGNESLDSDTALADRSNMAYAGSLVASGQGYGLVVAIANETETGRISQMMEQSTDTETPITRKINKFSHKLLYVVLGLAALVFVVGLSQADSWVEVFTTTVAFAVAAIPEGLPAIVTITLAIGVSRLARRHAIIRKLAAVETLGSTTVICSDKTGTQKAGLSRQVVEAEMPRLAVIPFESQFQYMATLHQTGSGKTIYVKGSMEAMFKRCDRLVNTQGQLEPLDRDRIERRAEAVAKQGLRILAFAKKSAPADQQSLDHSDLDRRQFDENQKKRKG